MRCLYCGKELALLKRLTGGGEFCSEAHKQSYQEEYNRLALSRLMQARAQKPDSKPAQPPPPQPAAPVAVAEPPVEEALIENISEEEPAAAKASAPLPEPEPPPPASAGFSMEMPSIAAPQQASIYVEPWLLEETAVPQPAWQLDGPSATLLFFSLPLGHLLPLAVQSGVKDYQLPPPEAQVSAKDFGQPKINLSARLSVNRPHEFQPCGSIAVAIAPRPSESSGFASLNGAIDFGYPTILHGFEMLAPGPAGIAFPGEDCDVTVGQSWTNGALAGVPLDIEVPVGPPTDSVPETPVVPAISTPPEATPRAALQALSRLHQDMRERQEAAPPPAPPKAAPDTEAAKPETEPAPHEASELLAISVKSFAPPKPGTIVNSVPLRADENPPIPRLKTLPLRPKVAPAPRSLDQQKITPGPAPAANPAAEAKTKPAPAAPAASAKAQRAEPPKTSKPAASVPASKPDQPPQTSKTEKPAETAKTKPATPAPAKPAEPARAPAPAAPPAAETGKSAELARADKPTGPDKPAKTAEAAKPAKTAEPAKPEAAEPKTKPPEPPKLEKAAAQAAGAAPRLAVPSATPTDSGVPNFGAVVNTSMFGSMKIKIGIGALAALLAIGGYFAFAGKSAKPRATVPAAADGVGPSIMLAQGGWVEGWAGDPNGSHAERQITIYRPSLKLSDYRFEFEGQIDTKSIGWVFRAADPQNYYAMKLVLVSPELPLQVALYKYLVLKGRQVQVGRVPVEVPVKNDTVFKIRVDVRGPKFSTFVQGQPVDVWTDDQLKTGGIGFLNERNERGRVKSVALFYLSGATK